MQRMAADPQPDTRVGPDLLESVWRYRWLVAAATVLAGLAGFAASFLQTTLYEAEARLLLDDPGSTSVFEDRAVQTGDRYVRNQAEAANSPQVMVRASELLEGQLTPEELRESVTARPSVDVDVLSLVARAQSPEDAALLADTVAEAYQELAAEDVQSNAEQAIGELNETKAELQARINQAEASLAANPGNASLQAQRDAASAQLIQIEGRADQIAVDAALYGSGVELFQEAQLPESPAQPQPVRNAAVAAVLGLLASSAFAWWRAEHTQTADRRQDAAPVLRAPLLGQVPDFAAVGVTGLDPTRSAPHSVAAEAFQFLVSSLEYALTQSNGSTVLITSAHPADGKTVTALNLAVAALRDGRRVLLADADERVRGLTGLCGAAPAPGLTDLVDDAIPFAGCTASVEVPGTTGLPFLPAGTRPDDPAGFFRTPGFRKVITRLREQADLVILDSPPILSVSDTSAIASQADGIVLVVSRGTSLRLLEEVRERLEFVGTPLLGYVFNRADVRGSAMSYGYGSYGSYGGYGYGAYGYGDGGNGSSDNGHGRAAAPAEADQRT